MSETLCYYCRKNEAEPKYELRTKLYKKLDSSYGIGLTGLKKTTKYYEKEIAVERCASCHLEHKRSIKPALITFLIMAVVAGIITGFLAKRVFITIVVAIVSGFVGMILYFMLVYRKRLKELGIKDEYATDDYPLVKELLKEGWQTYKP